MNVHFDGFKYDGLAYLDEHQASAINNAVVMSGDVLLNITGASIGRVTQAPPQIDGARVNQHVCIIRTNEAIDSTLLSRYLASPFVQSFIWSEQYGVTRQALTKSQILGFEIPVPPIAEQQRIVAALDAILAKVNTAKERLANVPKILKRFRQSVLAAACSGRLTDDWREQNSRDTEWEEKSLGDIFEVRTGGTPSRRNPDYFSGSIPWVKTAEVQNCDIYKTEEHISQEALSNSNAKVFPAGTLLVALYGEGKTRGQVGWLRIDAATNQACAALVNKGLREATRRYVYIYLLGQYYKLREQSAGGNQPNLSVGLIRNWGIALPRNSSEQQEIVRRVDALFAVADQIEARYEKARAHVDRLTQAVLAKAFRGELVPTEHALAEAEGRDYESATELLARIQATHAAPTNGAPKKRQPRAKRKAKT